jgi:N-acetylglucosamine PTS system EIICBA or EIICB component
VASDSFPIVVSLACLFIAFAMSYFYPIFDAGLTGLGKFIGASGAFGASCPWRRSRRS